MAERADTDNATYLVQKLIDIVDHRVGVHGQVSCPWKGPVTVNQANAQHKQIQKKTHFGFQVF